MSLTDTPTPTPTPEKIEAQETGRFSSVTVMQVDGRLFMFTGGSVDWDTKQLKIKEPSGVFSLDKTDGGQAWVERPRSKGHNFTYDNPTIDSQNGVIEAENYDGRHIRVFKALPPDFLNRDGLIDIEFVPHVEQLLAA